MILTSGPVVTPAMIEDYQRDGVICVRNVVDLPLIERLRVAVAKVLQEPTAKSAGEKPTGRFRRVRDGWRIDDAYRELVFESALPRVAAEMMASKTVRVLFDQTLVKEPNSTVEVAWHHDLPFWPVSGTQICSVWVALDEVTKDSGAVHYARGSHKSSQLYRPTVPGAEELRARGVANMDLPLAPNLFDDPHADLLCWDMQPGDALVFTARTLHGSGPNTRSDRTRRAIAPRFVGDDGRWVSGMHHLNTTFAEQPRLKTGDPLDDPTFPIAWTAP